MKALVRLAPLLVLVAACSHSSGFAQPKVSAFTAGSCRDLAPSVLKLGKDLHSLGTKPPSGSLRTSFQTAQKSVRDVQPSLDATLAPTVQTLVTAIGVLRIRTDTNSYDPSLAATAMTAYQSVVKACTTSS